jgi:hypothetical protein
MVMEKEFIPYELALRMKQIGFDILTEYSWVINVKYPEGIIGHSAPAFNHNKTEKHISAPLYQQAFRWFREKYDLYYTIGDIYGDFTKWSFAIGQKDKGIVSPFRENDIYFDTYEESEFACLIKLIEIVEKELIN